MPRLDNPQPGMPHWPKLRHDAPGGRQLIGEQGPSSHLAQVVHCLAWNLSMVWGQVAAGFVLYDLGQFVVLFMCANPHPEVRAISLTLANGAISSSDADREYVRIGRINGLEVQPWM